MPTNFQQHRFIKYSLKVKKEQQELGQQQQDSSKIIVILNRKLQDHHHFIPTTRKKRRCNPPNSYCKDHKCRLPQKKDELATETKNNTPTTTFDSLITELEFSYDCLATINVIYTSLHHAYSDSKGSIEQQGNGTRLCDMEKELLIAYDDLSLQINHLEKNIIKMEQKLIYLKSL